jgi:aminopeptidase N
MKQIIAIGGGGFGRNPSNKKIEQYIIDQQNKVNPNVCFIPTATGDNDAYKVNFYDVFTKLNCNPNHIDFFKRTVNLEEHIKQQDIIFVGGGNTKSMLAVWKDWGLDLLLKDAYERGVIMCGVSAGAICWFEKGITDSWADDLAILDCLGFVEGICCPHYDEEPARRPYVKKQLQQSAFKECLGIEGNAALHLIDGKPFKSVDFGKNKNSYIVTSNNQIVKEDPFEIVKV